MATLIDDDVKGQMSQIEATLDATASALDPILSQSPQDLEAMHPEVRFQLHLSLARASQSLFSIYLLLKNIDPSTHPIAKDRERIDAYVQRLDKFREQESGKGRRTTQLDVAAANRFITHAIPELTAEQKAQLKEVGRKHAAAASGEPSTGKKGAATPSQKKATAKVMEGTAEGFLDAVMGKEEGKRKRAAGEDSDGEFEAGEEGATAPPTTGTKRAKRGGKKQ